MRKTTIKLLHIDVVVESAESPDFGKLAEGQPCYRVVVDQRSEVGDEYNPMMGPVPVASKDFTRTVVYRLFGGLVPVLSAPSSDSKQQALEEDWFILRKLAVFTITLHNRNMRVHFDKVASDLWSIRLQIDHFPEYDSALFFMQIEPGRPFVFKMLHTGPCSFAVPHDQYSVGLFRENANRAFIRVSRPIHHDYRPNKDFMVWDRRTQALSEWEFYPRLHVPVQEVKAQPSGWNPWMGMRSLDKEITSPSFPCDERWKAVVSDCLPAFSSSLVNVVLGFARHRGRELIVVQPRPPRKEPLEGYLETEVEMDKRGGFMLFDLANDVLLGPIKSFWTGDLSYSLSPDIQRTAVASADGAWLACASFWPPRHGTPPHLGKFTMDEHVGLEALHHEYWTLTSSAFPHDELCLVRAPLPLINRLTKAQHDLSVVALYRCQPQAGGYRNWQIDPEDLFRMWFSEGELFHFTSFRVDGEAHLCKIVCTVDLRTGVVSEREVAWKEPVFFTAPRNYNLPQPTMASDIVANVCKGIDFAHDDRYCYQPVYRKAEAAGQTMAVFPMTEATECLRVVKLRRTNSEELFGDWPPETGPHPVVWAVVNVSSPDAAAPLAWRKEETEAKAPWTQPLRHERKHDESEDEGDDSKSDALDAPRAPAHSPRARICYAVLESKASRTLHAQGLPASQLQDHFDTSSFESPSSRWHTSEGSRSWDPDHGGGYLTACPDCCVAAFDLLNFDV